MTTRTISRTVGLSLLATGAVLLLTPSTSAQGPGGFGGPGFGGATREVLSQYDADKNGRLNAAERRAAREGLGTQGGGRGGRGGFGGGMGAGTPGPKVDKASVRAVPASVSFYDTSVMRTIFLDFENEDWEKELMAFKDTDINVPATLTMDGKAYKDVAVQFRGASSFMMVPETLKHSLDISMDEWVDNQNLMGFRSLNWLNGNGDPSLLRGLLYLSAARELAPAPRLNHVRVVINGESWGVFPNVEQVNKDFVQTFFKTGDGARWKVPGSPGGRGGLEYVGDDIEAYKRTFEIKSRDDAKAWQALVKLAKTLNETPADQLERALAPMLDIDNVLKFLAIDVTFVNTDGYWTRASDYNIYMDPKGMFRLIPHDANETFGPAGGRGGGPGGPGGPGGGGRQFAPPGGGPGGVPPAGAPGGGRAGGGRGGGRGGGEGGPDLDLLVGLNDPTKPLRSKLLAVPALRAKYLAYCKQLATKWLDWRTIEPIAQRTHAMIGADVKADTRKLWTNEAFDVSLAQLKTFVDARREYVLNYTPPAQ
jgi:hypothetical protein